jgi:hypothetical protein
MGCSTRAVLGVRSVDQRGGKGGPKTERGFEQSGSCKYTVSVETNTFPPYHLTHKVTGVGDVDDLGSSSSVDTLEQDMEREYNFTIVVGYNGSDVPSRHEVTSHVSFLVFLPGQF